MNARFHLLPALVALACSSSQGALTVVGEQGRPIPVTNISDTFVIPIVVDGVAGTAIVDTGSPIVVFDPSAFSGAGLPSGSGTVAKVGVGTLTVESPTVVGANLVTSPDPSIPIGGSLGCAILCSFAVSLNYRDATVTLGTAALPANVASAGTKVPFSLEGGGSFTVTDVPGNVDFPASRIAVSATVEGHVYAFVVDSGDSFVTLRESIFQGLVADGRGELSGLSTASVGGGSTSSVTRLRSFVVGGEEVDGLVASEDDAVEADLDAVSTEVGHEVDGIVGGSFLRQFYVTVDYPSSTLVLSKYTTGAPTFDSFDRVGMAVTPASSTEGATVSGVETGTNAASLGVSEGDVIVAIDGHALAELGATAIDALLSGPVGSTKSVQFGTASSSLVSMKTVSIGVDDLLPL